MKMNKLAIMLCVLTILITVNDNRSYFYNYKETIKPEGAVGGSVILKGNASSYIIWGSIKW